MHSEPSRHEYCNVPEWIEEKHIKPLVERVVVLEADIADLRRLLQMPWSVRPWQGEVTP